MSFKHWIMKQEGKTTTNLEGPDDTLVGWLVSHNGRSRRSGTRFGVVVGVLDRYGGTQVWARYANTEGEALESYKGTETRPTWVNVRLVTKIRYVGTDNL